MTAAFSGGIDLFATLLQESWIQKTLAFALLVGSIMELLERGGGISGFVSFVVERRSWVRSPRAALLVSYIIGILIFIESSITALIAGAVGRPLCDRYGISRAKLAYVCDATAAPTSSLIALNGWGALLLGLIATQQEAGYIEGDSLSWLLESLGYNFYAMSALLVAFVVIWFNIEIGPMRHASMRPTSAMLSGIKPPPHASAFFMVAPIFFMVASLFFFLYRTGNGNILAGSGSTSLFYTMLATLLFIYMTYIPTKKLDTKSYFIASFVGAKKLFGIALILLFAFALGKLTLSMHTGSYLASLVQADLPPLFLPALIFLLSGVMAFATGTSWGTFSIMIPVAVPMAVGVDANVALAMGAVISGGVFGDHCSPISDTTIIAALASECEVVEHVNTQLPYALLGGFIALLLFILFASVS